MNGRIRTGQEGFTLIEVLVAMLVFSTAAIGLLSISRDSAQTVTLLEDKYIARTIADSMMADLFTDTARLPRGDLLGEAVQMDRTYSWLRTIAESNERDVDLIRVQVFRSSDQLLLAETVSVKARRAR